jgi:uncharacterized membrane protein YphA (DoxX/SURF4 family)
MIQRRETGGAVFHLAVAAWLIWLIGYEYFPRWLKLGLSDALFPLVVAGLVWVGLWWVVRYLPGRLLVATSRVVLGVFFIGEAWGRIFDPQLFARILIDYDFLPYQLVNLTALTLPWFEVVVGLGLIVGLKGRLMAALAGMLILGALAVWVTGLVLGAAPGEAASLRGLIWRDVWLLILAGHVLCFEDGHWAVDRWLGRS